MRLVRMDTKAISMKATRFFLVCSKMIFNFRSAGRCFDGSAHMMLVR